MSSRVLRVAVVLGLAAAAVTGAVLTARASDSELAKVRSATARYHQPAHAQEAGWDLVEGLDGCFAKPGVGAMGYHYIDVASLDTSLDPLRPEALVYVPAPNGRQRLGAVEYIVPAEAWEGEGHEDPPAVLGRHLHLNEALGVYVLHAWIFEKNPDGVFEDWNPRVSCP